MNENSVTKWLDLLILKIEKEEKRIKKNKHLTNSPKCIKFEKNL